ncbi:hypothetical protein JOD57_004149 [Geodermatophilus bullaregiensis]|uniref:ComEA family DNA-binding protein n=1 Tax=Geodermatophilus bullaregiensis TaxID=1564160 RepID=UPI00195DD8BC|nr:helix-hairpin-helix domain-containing protein [Geodermatophilus bullaregiensis]MBM7808312.1 hypothetical protein [Geodermatophilus bullaregiensis]
MTYASTDPRFNGLPGRSAENRLLSASWRRRHSLWLLGPLFGLGMVTWASFLYIGWKARRRAWLVAGALYAVATAVGFYFTDGTEGPDGKSNEWLGGFLVALWVGGIVHALLSNRAWLTWRSQDTTPWYAQQAQQPVAGGTVPVPGPPAELSALGIDSSRFYAAAPPSAVPQQPVATLTGDPAPPPPPAPPVAYPAPLGAPTASHAPQAPSSVPPLDINEATEHQLVALPGVTPERAGRLVIARAHRGGFSTVEEFAEVAGLAPHEHQHIRRLVHCSRPASPRPAGGSSGGRVVDF